ncbi:MAG: ribosome biogenesis GTP-binding protein YihA/YsxC [Limnochordia bacterium]
MFSRAQFVTSAVKESQYPQGGKAEIALVGRSNVGKSSLINCILNRKNLARTSSRPGRTQTLNFYLIDDRFYLVDLPGYGFAHVSKKMRQQWGAMIEGYLLKRQGLVGIIQLVDARHDPGETDQQMVQWLKYHQLPHMVVATKIDKLPRSKQRTRVEQIARVLDAPVLGFSAVTGAGKGEVLEVIQGFLENKPL